MAPRIVILHPQPDPKHPHRLPTVTGAFFLAFGLAKEVEEIVFSLSRVDRKPFFLEGAVVFEQPKDNPPLDDGNRAWQIAVTAVVSFGRFVLKVKNKDGRGQASQEFRIIPEDFAEPGILWPGDNTTVSAQLFCPYGRTGKNSPVQGTVSIPPQPDVTNPQVQGPPQTQNWSIRFTNLSTGAGTLTVANTVSDQQLRHLTFT
jgi:hypothetical protein